MLYYFNLFSIFIILDLKQFTNFDTNIFVLVLGQKLTTLRFNTQIRIIDIKILTFVLFDYS